MDAALQPLTVLHPQSLSSSCLGDVRHSLIAVRQPPDATGAPPVPLALIVHKSSVRPAASYGSADLLGYHGAPSYITNSPG